MTATTYITLQTAEASLIRRGFEKTEHQHVWQNGADLASISIVLGGRRPKFVVAVEREAL